LTNFSFVIPNFNGAHLLPKCLRSLPKNQEVILVDNGSTDQSIKITQKLIPKIRIIKNSQNLGFAKAVNQGILAATNDYVALVNNDIVLQPNWFQNIARAISQNKNPPTVVFTGLVLNRHGTRIESEGLQYFSYGKCLNINNGKNFNFENYNLKLGHPHKIWGANAACTVYHRQTLINIGLFDQDFFAYEEDVDLALRLHHLGYSTLYVPNAIAYHIGGATSSKMGNFRHRMDARNWIYIIIKNYSSKELLTNLPQIVVERLRNLSGLIKNTSLLHILPSILSVYTIMLINIPLMIRKRRQIAKLPYGHRH